MWDPCIPEALKMFEDMTTKHTRALYKSTLVWKEYKDEAGEVIQLVPVVDMTFKF